MAPRHFKPGVILDQIFRPDVTFPLDSWVRCRIAEVLLWLLQNYICSSYSDVTIGRMQLFRCTRGSVVGLHWLFWDCRRATWIVIPLKIYMGCGPDAILPR